MTEYDLNLFNSVVLKQKNINLNSFDKNNNKKIDNEELQSLLSTGNVPHVSHLLTKDAVNSIVKEYKAELSKLEEKNIIKQSLFGAGLGAISGLAAAGYSGIAGVATLSGLAIAGVTGGAVLAVGAAGYFTTRYILNSKKENIEKELKNYENCRD